MHETPKITITLTPDFMKKNVNLPTGETFAQRLAKFRRPKGFTQAELGKRVGLSPTMIAYYETEAKNLPAELLLKIARAIKVSINDLANSKFGKDSDIINKWKLWKRVKLINQLAPHDQRAVFHYIKALLVKRKT